MPDGCLGMCWISTYREGEVTVKHYPSGVLASDNVLLEGILRWEYDPFPRANELPEISKTVVLND